MISFKRLFILLDEKGLNKAYLRKNGFNANTVDNLIKDKDLQLSTINRLCNLLDCTPYDIMEYKKDQE